MTERNIISGATATFLTPFIEGWGSFPKNQVL